MSSNDWPTENVPEHMQNIHAANLKMHRDRTKDNTDVDIVFQESNPGPSAQSAEQKVPKTVLAHKYIIQSRCNELLTKYPDNVTESGGRTTIKVDSKLDDLTEFTLNEILRYLYAEHITLTSRNTFVVLEFCKTYNLPKLANRCLGYIKRNINEKTVCRILEETIKYQHEDIGKKCEEYIAQNTKKVLEQDNFLKVNKTTVEKIVSMEELHIDEITLFTRCVEWAIKKVKLSDESPEEKGKKLREALGEKVLENIGFPAMTLEEFSSRVVPHKILNDSETVKIYNYIAAPKNKKPHNSSLKFPTRQRQEVKK